MIQKQMYRTVSETREVSKPPKHHDFAIDDSDPGRVVDQSTERRFVIVGRSNRLAGRVAVEEILRLAVLGRVEFLAFEPREISDRLEAAGSENMVVRPDRFADEVGEVFTHEIRAAARLPSYLCSRFLPALFAFTDLPAVLE